MNALKVFVFNVGQGDHILLKFPDGKYGVIDFYYDEKINAPCEPPALTYLKQKKNEGEKIELAFIHLSHYHEDHIKGLELFLEWVILDEIKLYELWLPSVKSNVIFKKSAADIVKNFVLPGPAIKKATSREKKELDTGWLLRDKLKRYLNKSLSNPIYALTIFERLQKSRQFKIEYLNGSVSLPKFKSKKREYLRNVKISTLGPSSQRADTFRGKSQDILLESLVLNKRDKKLPNGNDISVVLKIDYGKFRLIFGGDAERSSLHEVVANHDKDALEADFIKVFHHGAKGASSKKIWTTFLKEKTVTKLAISAGKGYDHPHSETFNHIKEATKSLKTKVEIFATILKEDIAEDCMDINDLEDKDLGWAYPEAGNTISTIDDAVNFGYSDEELARTAKIQNRYSANRLHGYLFDFHPENGIAVKKMISV